jgi:hypothetical protein
LDGVEVYGGGTYGRAPLWMFDGDWVLEDVFSSLNRPLNVGIAFLGSSTPNTPLTPLLMMFLRDLVVVIVSSYELPMFFTSLDSYGRGIQNHGLGSLISCYEKMSTFPPLKWLSPSAYNSSIFSPLGSF